MSAARRSEVALLAITVAWGLTFVTVQDAIALIPVATFLAYRFIAAALLLAVVFRSRLGLLGTRAIARGLQMGAFLAAGYLLQTYGLEATTASQAGFITGLFVVITPLIARVTDRTPIGPVAWAAAAVSAVGLFLISGAGASFNLRGDGLELLCAFAFAGHIVVTSHSVREGHDVGGLVVVQLAVVGVVCLAIAIASGDLVVPRGATVWGTLALTSLVATALAFMVQSWAQKRADPARTALILAAEPAFAGLFGWLLAGDRLGAIGWLGAILILGSILAVEMVPRLRPPRPLPEG